MTGACVATGHIQRGDELVTETNRLRLLEVFDDDRNADCARASLDSQCGPSIFQRLDETTRADGHHAGGFRGQNTDRGQVALAAIAIAAGDEELLHRARSGQADRFRMHEQRERLTNDGRWFGGACGESRDHEQCQTEKRCRSAVESSHGCALRERISDSHE